MKHKIDRIDQIILRCLIKNARMPYLEIARECGVSGAAIHQRIKKLEDKGIITGSRLLVRPEALDLNICAFVAVSLTQASDYKDVIDELEKIPEVVECHFVTGEFSLLVKLYCVNNDHLMKLILKTIQGIHNVSKTVTYISLDQAIDRQVFIDDYSKFRKEKVRKQ